MPKIAFVVTDPKENLYQELEQLSVLLISKGFVVDIVSYLDEEINWQNYDLISFNGCTRYYLHIEKFRAFCKKISEQKIKTVNPLSVILWNVDKKYLADLAKEGFNLTTTIWVEQNQQIDLAKKVNEFNWKKIIIKPTLSAGSFNTSVFDLTKFDLAQKHLQEITKYSAAMIQKFIPEVIENGEYSAIFLDKKFSHLVLKTPATNDFRAGIRQGASVVSVDFSANREIVEYAEEIVKHIKEDLSYARVDLVVSKNQILLMELELIEPLLYSEFSDGFVEKYCNLLIRRC
ncbi:MAG: ATP-grasp domain-containing protein [Rickettsiales bacterium]|nr:ATP-grasp domain-containing protein [Rickettsiales bacterium]